MSFNSPGFIFFFPFVFFVSWMLVKRASLRIWFLLLASGYFYGCRTPWWLLPLFASCAVDYVVALRLPETKSERARKTLLAISVVSNLGLLFFFKYYNFLGESFSDLAGLFGYRPSWVDLNIVLPAGISFYTFQTLSYTIDVYRGELKPVRSISGFAMFISFFPQLVAGPIVRASHFLPQLEKKPVLNNTILEGALFLIASGYVKKMILGDYLAGYVESAFDGKEAAGFASAWLGVFAFSFQIYFDFSGYTDIAIGIGQLLGYDFCVNFRRPYAAVSFSDFWRRWHISLSTWLRDYLYIPLGGSRGMKPWHVYRNVMLTMVIGGFWHGASWNFVIWGALHGLFLVAERAAGVRSLLDRQTLNLKQSLPRIVCVFLAATFAWTVFRSRTMESFLQLMGSLTTVGSPLILTKGMLLAAAVIVLGWAAQISGERIAWQKLFLRLPFFVQSAIYAVLALFVMIMSSAGEKPFIYFQF